MIDVVIRISIRIKEAISSMILKPDSAIHLVLYY